MKFGYVALPSASRERPLLHKAEGRSTAALKTGASGPLPSP